MENKESVCFDDLYKINVNDYVEQKKTGSTVLTYLSWASCWALFKKKCPDADYEIRHFDGKPYLYDEKLGYMVETSVTANGETKTMWLPVMDGANKAMKAESYTYETKFGQKSVAPATMFDINTTIMRCLVKNIAMFGLGLYIYAGDDLPEGESESVPTIESIVKGILEKMTVDNAMAYYGRAIKLYDKTTPEFKAWYKVWKDRKEELDNNKVQAELKSDADYLNSL